MEIYIIFPERQRRSVAAAAGGGGTRSGAARDLTARRRAKPTTNPLPLERKTNSSADLSIRIPNEDWFNSLQVCFFRPIHLGLRFHAKMPTMQNEEHVDLDTRKKRRKPPGIHHSEVQTRELSRPNSNLGRRLRTGEDLRLAFGGARPSPI